MYSQLVFTRCRITCTFQLLPWSKVSESVWDSGVNCVKKAVKKITHGWCFRFGKCVVPPQMRTPLCLSGHYMGQSLVPILNCYCHLPVLTMLTQVDVYMLKEKGTGDGGSRGSIQGAARMKRRQKEWQYLDSVSTDKHGRVTYSLTPEPPLPQGLYPVTFLVK